MNHADVQRYAHRVEPLLAAAAAVCPRLPAADADEHERCRF